MPNDDYKPEFFLFHQYGPTLRATFSSAADARIWERGNRGQPYADMFYIENADGERMTFKQNAHGHAYAILAALDESAAPEGTDG